jgi:hypothetical protein
MPLRFKLDSLDGVAEEQRSLYRETDSGFVLDVEGDLISVDDIENHEKTSGLKSALQKERQRAREEERRRKELEGRLGDLNPDDLDELKTLREKERAREEDEAKRRGEFDRLKQDMAERHKAEVESYKSKVETLLGARKRDTLNAEIGAAFAETGVINPAVMNPYIRERLTVEMDDDGNASVYVRGEDGQPRYNAEGNPLSVREFVESLTESNEFKPFFASRQKSGAGATGGDRDDQSGGGSGGMPSREELDAMTPSQQKMAERKAKIAGYRKAEQSRG